VVEEARNLKPGNGEKMQEKETLDERLPGLFEPDTLLPIQYFEAMRKKHLLEGEKRLILSVLEDAVECFMKCIDASTSKGQRLFRDADEWIAHEDKRWVFSFDNVCDMLDINPEYMRMGLRKWKEKRLDAIARRRAELIEQAEREAAAAAAHPEGIIPVPEIAPTIVAPIAMQKVAVKVAPKTAVKQSQVQRREHPRVKRTTKLRKARA
jgi:hypothetical protein